MPAPKNVKYIILHTSDSNFGNVGMIRDWHLARKMTDIGYHYVVLNGFWDRNEYVTGKRNTSTNGKIDVGRSENEIGAHAYGYNGKSIGVCMVGKNGKYTAEQMEASISLLASLVKKYSVPVAKVIGHYETWSGKAQGKTCPVLDMHKVREQVVEQLARS